MLGAGRGEATEDFYQTTALCHKVFFNNCAEGDLIPNLYKEKCYQA
jgi:hypothetical protein